MNLWDTAEFKKLFETNEPITYQSLTDALNKLKPIATVSDDFTVEAGYDDHHALKWDIKVKQVLNAPVYAGGSYQGKSQLPKPSGQRCYYCRAKLYIDTDRCPVCGSHDSRYLKQRID